MAAVLRQLQPSFDFVFRFTLSEASREWQAILADAARFGVGDRLVTLGVLRVSELAAAYRDACAVYLPTLREISSAVYPESFFFRRPLITTDMDFARELCGDAALLVEPRNPVAAASALLSLAPSPELAGGLVAAGEQRLLASYPTPGDKFEMQIDLLARAAATGRQRRYSYALPELSQERRGQRL